MRMPKGKKIPRVSLTNLSQSITTTARLFQASILFSFLTVHGLATPLMQYAIKSSIEYKPVLFSIFVNL